MSECQVRTGQVRTGQVRKSQVSIGSVRTGQSRTGQVRTGQSRTGQVRIGRVRTGQVNLDQILSQHKSSQVWINDQVMTGQVKFKLFKSDRSSQKDFGPKIFLAQTFFLNQHFCNPNIFWT